MLTHPRFRIVRTLGQGALGVVYAADDLERSERVALKALLGKDSQALFSLKREFRALANLQHANLVALYDLFAEGDEPFFTMEFVDGVDLRTHCTGNCEAASGDPAADTIDASNAVMPCDEQLVRQVLPQLCEGIQTLHDAGILHRDIKPMNVLVSREHRVKILDFGLAVDVDALHDETRAGQMVGTVAYMSPEQASGEVNLTPASDWYSVGVMLYELLTAQLPFAGASFRMAMEKQSGPAVPPRQLVCDVPEDLNSLCEDLLERSPDDRPGGKEILRRVRAESTEPVKAPTGLPEAPTFAGRTEELATLRAAFDRVRVEGARAVLVRGASGVGKTTLVQECFARVCAEEPDLVFLAGRCYERETVAYRAMDGVIDELSRHWRKLPELQAGALLPREAGRLRQLFPVLGRVPAIAGEPDPVAREDPEIRRTRGYAALRETFQRLASRRPLVAFLDDLQWVDRDSVNLLADLIRSPDPPRLLLVLCSRNYPTEDTPLLAELVKSLDPIIEILEIGPLPPADSRELARSLARSANDEMVALIADESDGNPFLLGELARYVHSMEGATAKSLRLEDVFGRRQASLNTGQRHLLDCICIAGKPIPRSVVRSAAGQQPGEFNNAVRTLGSDYLIRSAGGEREDHLEPYHSRIREIVVSLLSDARRVQLHRELAVALDASGEASDDQLARHWRGAGEHLRAAKHARDAGNLAAASTDFDAAAGWYRIALELGNYAGEEARELWALLGEALGYAGSPIESADAYKRAAEHADRAQGLDFRRQVMEQLLGGGYVKPGLDSARALLAEVSLGLPDSPLATIFAIARNELALRLHGLKWTPRAESEISVDAVAQAQIALSVGMTLGATDTLRANALLGRGLLLSLKLGEPALVVRATTYATGMAAALGKRQRAETLMGLTEEAAGIDGSRHSLGMADAARVFLEFFVENRWSAACETANRALDHFAAAGWGRFWERDACLQYRAFAQLYGGQLRTMHKEVSELIQSTERSGNRLLNVGLRTGLRIRHLLNDDPDAALKDLDEALAAWIPAEDAFQVQHWYALWGRCEAALYSGAVAAAEADLDQYRKTLERSLLTKIVRVRCEFRHLDGRVALARAALSDSGNERKREVSRARRFGRKLMQEGIPMGRLFARLLESGARHAEGLIDESVLELRETVAELEETETNLYAAAAKRQLGVTIGGDEGARLVEAVDGWMADQGVERPDRMSAMLVPGWPHPG